MKFEKNKEVKQDIFLLKFPLIKDDMQLVDERLWEEENVESLSEKLKAIQEFKQKTEEKRKDEELKKERLKKMSNLEKEFCRIRKKHKIHSQLSAEKYQQNNTELIQQIPVSTKNASTQSKPLEGDNPITNVENIKQEGKETTEVLEFIIENSKQQNEESNENEKKSDIKVDFTFTPNTEEEETVKKIVICKVHSPSKKLDTKDHDSAEDLMTKELSSDEEREKISIIEEDVSVSRKEASNVKIDIIQDDVNSDRCISAPDETSEISSIIEEGEGEDEEIEIKSRISCPDLSQRTEPVDTEINDKTELFDQLSDTDKSVEDEENLDIRILKETTPVSRINEAERRTLSSDQSFQESETRAGTESYFEAMLEYSQTNNISRRLETLELLNRSFEADFSQTTSIFNTLDKIFEVEDLHTENMDYKELETISEGNESQKSCRN